jgi:S-formylglutathione hydrolase
LGIEGEEKDWDFGTGAGMYVDATNDPWTKGYFMYSYITKGTRQLPVLNFRELPSLLSQHCPEIDLTRQSITGHSMGG